MIPDDDDKQRAEVLGPVPNPELHQLYDYWRARCKDGRLPGRVQPPRMDMNGRFVDEHPDAEFRRQALSVYTQVATTRRPLSVRHDVVMDGRVRRHQTLLLPLAADGVTVDMVVAVMRYQPRTR